MVLSIWQRNSAKTCFARVQLDEDKWCHGAPGKREARPARRGFRLQALATIGRRPRRRVNAHSLWLLCLLLTDPRRSDLS